MSSKFDDKTSLQPPYTNRGASYTTENDVSDCFLMENTPKKLYEKKSRKFGDFSTDFDWYQGTVFFPSDDVLDDQMMLDAFLEIVRQDVTKIFPDSVFVPDVKSVNKYTNAQQYNDPLGNRILLIEYGGNRGVHLTSSGYHSRDLVKIIQSYGALVTRADIAHDVYEYPTKFETVAAKIIKFAKSKGLQIDQQGDWSKDGRRGRSLYVGSRKSRVFLNLYEKSFESGDVNLINSFPNWFRFEFRFKPQEKESKQLIVNWTPQEYLSSIKWVSELCDLLQIPIVDSGNMRPPRRTDDFELKKRHFFKQYKNFLADLTDEAGGIGNLGFFIDEQIKKYA